MSTLTTFELIAGSASILGFVIAVGHFALKLRRTCNRKRQDAEREFKQEIDRLHAAGETVSARTDLGFFVLIELGSLRDSIACCRHWRTSFMVLAVSWLVFWNFSSAVIPEVHASRMVVPVCLLLDFLLWVIVLLVHLNTMRSQKYTARPRAAPSAGTKGSVNGCLFFDRRYCV